VLLDALLETSGLAAAFAATLAGDEVAAGKPDPQIYRDVCDRLGHDPGRAVAIEDSGSGIASGLAAGLKVAIIARA
jgi:HAD superfamily hydrolase (TIGR01509 family)